MPRHDELDEMIAERTASSPAFPVILATAERRRELLRELAREREARDLSQTQIAAAMNTSQSAIGRLETTATDAKLSTVERFAAALGYKLEYSLVRTDQSE